MIRRPPRSTLSSSSAASDVYKRQMLPQVLKEAGYKTHAIGKWHCGFPTLRHTPTYRGFDSFLGYWHWGEEYTEHVFPPYYDSAKCRGVDMTNATGRRLDPVLTAGSTRSADLFLDQAEQIIAAHPKDHPLYLYLALQNAHDPYEEAPVELTRKYPEEHNVFRRNFSAIVTEMDDAVGRLVFTLKKHDLWEDTLLWFNADNGGELVHPDLSGCNASCSTPACCGGAGNNSPLRGGKFTLWEGGLRVPAFAYSPSAKLIPRWRRGQEWHGLMHTSDLFETFAQLAGIEDSHGTDGHRLWSVIQNGHASSRTEIIHQAYNQYSNGSCTAADLSSPYVPSCGVAFTQWPYKLVVGFGGDDRHVPLPPDAPKAMSKSAPCVETPCLFDIENDPSEEHDLASVEERRVQRLVDRLKELSAPECLPQPPDSLTPAPSDAECDMVHRTGAYLPWQKDEIDL
eukprot:TRINITY_DN15212_c0_g1_i4.p1 TRINITY_DN15212_c0_g1~~TRINITY_DN15212_c0_g1_i4.p1  ORF type:complete len:454 (+),score=104.07 TRINITY_DN15212_c0_g1_i4:58-1419(+)